MRTHACGADLGRGRVGGARQCVRGQARGWWAWLGQLAGGAMRRMGGAGTRSCGRGFWWAGHSHLAGTWVWARTKSRQPGRCWPPPRPGCSRCCSGSGRWSPPGTCRPACVRWQAGPASRRTPLGREWGPDNGPELAARCHQPGGSCPSARCPPPRPRLPASPSPGCRLCTRSRCCLWATREALPTLRLPVAATSNLQNMSSPHRSAAALAWLGLAELSSGKRDRKLGSCLGRSLKFSTRNLES